MDLRAAYRTVLTPDEDYWGKRTHSNINPVASDNVIQERVLLYGPKGEALIKQVPRKIGFKL